MNNVTLITKDKITAAKVSQTIIDDFPFSKKTSQNDDVQLYIGKYPKEAYIAFSDELSINDPNAMFEEEDLRKIPFENASVNYLYFRRYETIISIIESILKHYPELYICDENGNISPAIDYIKTIKN